MFKKFLLPLLLFFSVSGQALAENHRNYKLTCDYSYASPYQQSLKTETFSIFSQVDRTGQTRFHMGQEFISAYFFEGCEISPKSVWHNDARFEFEAILEDSTLIYNFKFFNYLCFRQEGLQLLQEYTKEIDVSSINKRSQAIFFGSQGKILRERSNQDHWVKEDGVAITKCVLDAF